SVVRVGLGLLVTIGLMMWAAWLAMAGVAIGGAGAQQIAASPEPALPPAPTPAGSTVAFDQVWISSSGNTIIAGQPIVDSSSLHLGTPVIRVAVTLTNNGETDWSPVFTTFSGTLNHAPVQESSEGDWKYSTPIVPYTSVTLSKVFLAGSGQFTLAVHTPEGVALFTGRA
ncbi:MAG: hypothetical protein ACRDTT_32095, partial [Pseudonocardiaceae bacterium]